MIDKMYDMAHELLGLLNPIEYIETPRGVVLFSVLCTLLIMVCVLDGMEKWKRGN